MTLLSLVPKKKDNVLLMSSMQPETCSTDKTTGDNFKPEIITFYNITKSEMDTVEKICTIYSVARKCNS